MVNFVRNIQESTTRNQFLAVISIICKDFESTAPTRWSSIVNLLSFSNGAAIGWASPFIPLLLSELSPIGQITIEEISWIGALFAIGVLIGTILFAFVTKYVGKKYGIMLLAVPHIVSWLLIFFGSSVNYLYAARVVGGCTGGGILRQFSLYITDISENHVRGTLFSIYPLVLNTGILFGFITGEFLSYHTVPMLMMFFPIIFLILVSYLPETPHCLLQANRLPEAETSFKFYRNIRPDGMLPAQRIEFELLKKMIETTDKVLKSSNVTLADLTNKIAIKGLSIGLFLMALYQFSGCFAIITYTASIFKESGSSLNANLASIIVAVIQILGTYCSTIFVDRAGRKILLLVSASGASIGLAAMGGFSYLIKQEYDLSSLSWVPILSLSFVVFIGSIGIITLPYVVLAEVVPNKIREVATTICIVFMSCCAFLVLKGLPVLMTTLELYGCMWLFSGVCAIGTVVIFLFIPETKGKSLVDGVDDNKI